MLEVVWCYTDGKKKKKKRQNFKQGIFVRSYGRWKIGGIKLGSASIARSQMTSNMVLNSINEVQTQKGLTRDPIRRQN